MENFDSYGDLGISDKRFTFAQAKSVASQLIQLNGVSRIELFGSVARNLRGNDIDLIIVVDDEETYRRFLAGVRKNIREDMFGNELGARLRLAAVFEMWMNDWPASEPLWSDALLLDLFVMPKDWHARTDELQKNLPHNDSSFVRTIAKDARVICEKHE